MLLVLLVLAVPGYGLAGVAARLVGPNHVHRTAVIAPQAEVALEDFRRGASDRNVGGPPHQHRSWQRHGHALADASVVSLDGDGHEAADADAHFSWTLFPPHRGSAWEESDASAANTWPRMQADRVPRVAVIPLDRPPKT